MKNLFQIAAILSAVSLASTSVLKSNNGTFELLILHNNDMHARFEQTSQLSGICTAADEAANKCYGGFARVATVVKEARRKAATGEGPPVLYLNAGDTYTGSAWFTIYKWKIAAEFINALQPDAVSLGNDNVNTVRNGLNPILRELNVPIVATNIILHTVQDEELLHKSIIINIEGMKVGLVGYLTLDTNALNSSGNAEYVDEIIALQEEVTRLHELGINIIVAIGRADVQEDIEIARQVEGVDIIISGTRNVYFWNGIYESEAIEEPILVNQASGNRALVVKSHMYNKYLGSLLVQFDEDGKIKAFNGQPILLDPSIPRDPVISLVTDKLLDEINTSLEEIVGTTAVILDGNSCKTEECNLGNLITDAMMLCYAVRYEGNTWTDAPIAVLPGGMISGSIAPANRPAEVKLKDLLTVLPSESTVVAVTINGTILLQMLEHSGATFNDANPTGQLLQISGIRLTYDTQKEVGSRVVNPIVRCWSCVLPYHYVIDNWRTYKLLMPASLANGDYGYTMLSSLPKEELDYDEITCVKEYMELQSPVYPEVAGRFEIMGAEDSENEEESSEEIIGITAVTLDGSSCKTKECNFGNLITDAMMLYYAARYEGNTWTDAPIAVIPGGMISGSIAPANRPADIKLEDLLKVLPSESKLVTVTMNGTVLLQMLEHSGSTFNVDNPTGRLLQISGIRLTYDIDNEVGSRVVNPVVRCWSCVLPNHYEIDDWRTYKLLMPASLANGDYGYTMLTSLPREELDYDEITCVKEYMELQSPVYPEVAGRFAIMRTEDSETEEESSEEIIGKTAVLLDGNSCKTEECNFGNLITDAMMLYYAARYEGNTWTDAPIAVIPGGMISGSIATANRPADVKLEDLLKVLPSESKLVTVTMNGTVLLQMLEHSGSTFNVDNSTGRLLQFSGIRLTYDIDKEVGSRVVNPIVRCWSCVLPHHYEIDNWRTYKLLMPASLANGDYGYTMLTSLPREELDYDEITCVKEYMKLQSPVYPEVAGRFEIMAAEDSENEQESSEEVIGITAVTLDGSSCKTEECNFGNLITDAMMLYYAARYEGNTWTDAPIAVIPGGMISGSIAPANRPADVKLKDLLTVLPYESKLVTVTMNGTVLLQMLEHSGSTLNVDNPTGRLLQFSGIRLTYDIDKEVGSRVVNPVVRCWSCVLPHHYEIDNWRTYKLLMPASLANGDYGYTMLTSLPREELDYDEITCVKEYMELQSPVYPEVAGRFAIMGTEDSETEEESSEEIIGKTAVILDGNSCKTQECNFGNMITDAIMLYYAARYEGNTWTDAPIAVIPGGIVSGSIAPANRPADVKLEDLLKVLPSESKLVTVTMTGPVLLEMLEHSGTTFNETNPTGQLLQTSGIRLTYDLDKEIGFRVVNPVVRCWSCTTPNHFDIDNWRTYKLLMPASLANGGYGYTMLTSLPKEELDYDMITCVREYMKLRRPVYPEVSGRLKTINSKTDGGEDDSTPPPPEEDDTTPIPPEEDDSTPPPPEEDDSTPPPPEEDDSTPPPPEEDDSTPPPPEEDDSRPPSPGEEENPNSASTLSLVKISVTIIPFLLNILY